MDKKAQMGALVKIILLVACTILIIALIVIIYARFNAKTPIEVCRINVAAQSMTKVNVVVGQYSPIPLECHKRYVKFYDRSVEEGDDPSNMEPMEILYSGKKVKKIPELNDYVVNQVIAEEMRVCFYEFGEGKLKVFDKEVSSLFLDRDVCFVCSDISFDKSKGKTYNGFFNYIVQTRLLNENMTYFQYFSQPGLSKSPWILGLYAKTDNGVIEFPDSGTYNVVFIKEDKGYFNQLYTMGAVATAVWKGEIGKAALEEVKGATGWNEITDANNNYHVYVLKSTDLNKYCSYQAG